MPAGSRRQSGRSAIADQAELAGTLAPLARLALAYAPAPTREDWLTWLGLDARLASVVRSAREPILAQLKLAWWRDRLTGDSAAWPKGEPLLARLAGWDDRAGLTALVDGWEALLGEPPLGRGTLETFAEGRAGALATLAAQIGANPGDAAGAAHSWALAELAVDLPDPADRAAAARLLGERPRLAALPRPLRPLAVLAGTTGRAALRGGAAELYRPGSFVTAVRLGLLGR